MGRSDEAIAKLLLDAGVIDRGQLAAARDQIVRWGGRLHHVVVEMGLAREDHVARAIATGTNLPRVALGTVPPDASALHRLDAALCEERNVFPCALRDNGATLWLAVSDPTDPELSQVARTAGVSHVRPVVAGFDEIQDAILRTYRGETHRRWATGEPFSRITPTPSGAPIIASVPGTPPPIVAAVPGAPAMVPGAFPAPGVGHPAASTPAVFPGAPLPTPPGGWPAPTQLSTPPGGWPVPAPETSAARIAAGAATIAKTLDELVGLAGTGALSPDQLQRLAALRANQDRMARVLKALIELCAERGVFTLDSLKERLRS